MLRKCRLNRFCKNNAQSYCTACAGYYCDDCWPEVDEHLNEGSDSEDVSHEKLNSDVVQRIEECISQPRTTEDARKQHEDDEAAMWFGVTTNASEELELDETLRYSSLIMSSGSSLRAGNRFPRLVSFVGRTGQFGRAKHGRCSQITFGRCG